MQDAVRLEEERRAAKSPVIHCYDHRGQGVVLHWGCALQYRHTYVCEDYHFTAKYLDSV